MEYTIQEHSHRFAAWAAARAASTSSLCRFRVEQGKQILERAMHIQTTGALGTLPQADRFDMRHRQWREGAITVARKQGLPFTHGIAAKLINVYLKSVYVCGGLHDDPRVKAIHPPIDSALLDTLYREDIAGERKAWKEARDRRWSKLDSAQYEALIAAIKRAVPGDQGLWTIEEYWPGSLIKQPATRRSSSEHSPDLKTELVNAIIEALDAHTVMSSQALGSEVIQAGLREILLGAGELYEKLRTSA